VNQTDRLTAPIIMSAAFVANAGHASIGIGERLHLYEALARLESATALQLAMATRCSVWFADGWLQAQARQGCAVFDAATDRYSLFCRIEAKVAA
jgi:hypothetical protein